MTPHLHSCSVTRCRNITWVRLISGSSPENLVRYVDPTWIVGDLGFSKLLPRYVALLFILVHLSSLDDAFPQSTRHLFAAPFFSDYLYSMPPVDGNWCFSSMVLSTGKGLYQVGHLGLKMSPSITPESIRHHDSPTIGTADDLRGSRTGMSPSFCREASFAGVIIYAV